MINPLKNFTGLVAPLDRPNVDTDQIIPKQFLKAVVRSGLAKGLFFDWRNQPDSQFVLNQPRFEKAEILVARANFGCGSSREHAVWALADFGFRAVIAPSFADIFANNCAKNGVLTVVLTGNEVEEIVRRATEHDDYDLHVDLKKCRVHDDYGFSATFQVDDFTRHCL